MAKEASFDVVSVVDMQEVDNAHQQTLRELAQRYDLKDSGATVSFSKKEGSIVIEAPSDFVSGQVRDVLVSKLVKRGVDVSAVRWSDPVAGSGFSVRVTGRIVQGIDQDTARRIAKDVRGSGLKAKATIEGDKLRVSSASRDVLQSVIALLREGDYGQPLQFVNYR